MMYFESLFLELSLLETSAMMTVCIIRKCMYSPFNWLIVISLTNINQEQYNYYNGSSISHAHIASTITYPHFNSLKILQYISFYYK